MLQRAGKTWDDVQLPEVKVADLSKDAMDAFRSKAVMSNRMTESEVNVSDELLLRNLKLLDGDKLIRAAVLLFHPMPEHFTTGAYIKIGYFAPVAAFGDNEEIVEDLQYQDVVDGPLMLQADKATELIYTKYFKGLIDYEGNQRTETKMLSRGILRELLLNAINHKNYATGVPIQVSVYEDRIEIFNMGTWSKQVPTDERIYEKHASVPYNPKIADVSFRSGDVESWGRGFLRIKAECNKINAPLPKIDAENDCVSITAAGCEKYMSLLRYGQYGQVGVDGVWRDKKKETGESGDKKQAKKTSDKKQAKKTSENIEKIRHYLEQNGESKTSDIAEHIGLSPARTRALLSDMEEIEAVGGNSNRKYRMKEEG